MVNTIGSGTSRVEARTDTTLGSELDWNWFSAGVEYRNVDSDVSPYTSTRFFQSATFEPFDGSNLRWNLSHVDQHFDDTGNDQKNTSAIGKCSLILAPNALWSLSGGIRRERGDVYDRDIETFRTEIRWRVGRLSMNTGFEYESEESTTETRKENYYYIRMARALF